jgi:hypothetical protein
VRGNYIAFGQAPRLDIFSDDGKSAHQTAMRARRRTRSMVCWRLLRAWKPPHQGKRPAEGNELPIFAFDVLTSTSKNDRCLRHELLNNSTRAIKTSVEGSVMSRRFLHSITVVVGIEFAPGTASAAAILRHEGALLWGRCGCHRAPNLLRHLQGRAVQRSPLWTSK